MAPRSRLSALVAVFVLTATAPAALAAIPAGPPTRDVYDVWTIGDSYASGEGAPDRDGVYRDNGDVIDGQFEDWDTRFDGSPAVPGLNQDSTRCHRSGATSTSAVATAALRSEFPDINVSWTSVACGGASIVETGKFGSDAPPNKGGVLTPYDGAETMSKRGISADALSPAVYPPQLRQINDRFSGRVDALLMNLGGNDLGFGELIAQCLGILPLAGDCHTNDDLNAFITQRFDVLAVRFDRLAAALRGTPQGRDPALARAPHDVFLTKAPNPLRPTATSFCDRTPAGNYEENLKAAESEWLDINVVRPLNARFQTEAQQHGWHIVGAHVNQFTGHAICSPAPANWINTNLQALRIQGELDEANGPADIAADVSGGIAHPNRNGFAAIGAALRDVMRPELVERYTPDAAPATEVPSTASGFSVATTDPPPVPTSGYWHRLRVRQVDANSNVSDLPAPDGLRDVSYGTSTTAYARTGRFFVTARSCGPLSRNATIGCGPSSAELPVSTFVPARPVELTADGQAPQGVFFPSPGITVGWKHANALARHDTRFSVVRLVNAGQTVEKTVSGPFTSSRVTGLLDGKTYSITVKACNHGNRCSTTLGPITARADQGQSSASKITDLDRIATAIEGVPCARASVPFDPALGSSPGFEDQTPSFRPACLSEPPVGRLNLRRRVTKVRRGRAAPVELQWRHPGQWRALREVAVGLVTTRGTLATLRFDQDASRILLAAGAGRRGPSIQAGQAGRLSVRGVRVRVGRDALEGSGPAGRDIHMRFALVLPRRAGREVGLSIGADDDAGQRQAPVAAGVIEVRR